MRIFKGFLFFVLFQFCFSGVACATMFAHVTAAGSVLDPQADSSASIYLKRYNSSITADWHVEQVPDGVQHGARYSGSVTPGSEEFLDRSKYINPGWLDLDGNPVAHEGD